MSEKNLEEHGVRLVEQRDVVAPDEGPHRVAAAVAGAAAPDTLAALLDDCRKEATPGAPSWEAAATRATAGSSSGCQSLDVARSASPGSDALSAATVAGSVALAAAIFF